MDLIIGGAYQGKLDYAKEKFAVKDEDVYICEEDKDIDMTKRCLYHVEKYMLRCVREGDWRFFTYRKDAVIICDDIFCGVVPVDAEMRSWREATGRLVNELTKRADSVTRIFCGIPQRLK